MFDLLSKLSLDFGFCFLPDEFCVHFVSVERCVHNFGLWSWCRSRGLVAQSDVDCISLWLCSFGVHVTACERVGDMFYFNYFI